MQYRTIKIMPVKNTEKRSFITKKRLRIAVFIVLGVLVYGLIPQIGSLKPSLGLLKNADPVLIFAAIAVSLFTYAGTALIYVILAPRSLRYGRTLLIQYAAASVNRLVPAGVGGMGANVAYLHAEKLRFSEALATATLNNVSGIVGHLVMLTILFVGFKSQLTDSGVDFNGWVGLLVVALFVLSIGILIVINNRLRSYFSQFIADIRAYRYRKKALAAAVAVSMLVTFCNVLCIWVCCQALDVHISLVAALLVLTGAVGAGAAVPTPGAIGAFEAGMYAVLVTLHAAPASAFAAVLLFRLITYWLPLIVGSPVLVYCQRKRYFGVSL
jgi:glycosyltransferase 2 family protein